MPDSRSSNARVRLVLPAPDGAAMTKRLPAGVLIRVSRRVAAAARDIGSPARRVAVSFDVLHLLAHLLDHDLELQRGLRQLRVDRLGSQRVGFAIEFLHQEVEALAARSAGM